MTDPLSILAQIWEIERLARDAPAISSEVRGAAASPENRKKRPAAVSAGRASKRVTTTCGVLVMLLSRCHPSSMR